MNAPWDARFIILYKYETENSRNNYQIRRKGLYNEKIIRVH